jgi:dTDP-4-dehydrorhamnose reductase
MKVFVFGSTGMLGHYVTTYLENEGFNIVRVTRNLYDLSQVTYKSLSVFLEHFLSVSHEDVIINCAGIINQRGAKLADEYYKVNSYFPRYLNRWCNFKGCRVIQASTDCIFSGKKGSPYDETDEMDATDIYGFSKAMGEAYGSIILRVSIIGEELENKVSFLEFVRSNAGGVVNGFTNQVWNGITCLQWAKNAKVIINNPNKYRATHTPLHFFTEPIKKIEAVSLVNDVYNLGIDIIPIEAPKEFNKSLTTIYDKGYFEDFQMPSLRQQLEEMKEFKLR